MCVRTTLLAALSLVHVAFGAADDGLKHVLICHNGDSDPSTEGWYRSKIHAGEIAEEPVTEDRVGGLAAWCIDDDGTLDARVALSYQKMLTVPELAVVDGRRWRFTMHLRVVESLQRPNFSVCGEVANSTTRHLMRFTTDDQDNTVLTLGLHGPTMTAKIRGLGYHRFDFVFEPTKGKCGELAVFVDGDEEPVLTGYTGESPKNVTPRLVWGSNESGSSGQGHYHLVEFAVEEAPAPPPPLPKSYVAVDNVCAWPNLTVMPDGAIVATIYSLPSHGGGEGDAQCWASTDQGKTWTLRGTPAMHEPGTCRMNLAAGLARNDDLIVLCSGWDKRDMSAPRHTRILKPWICRSSDGGRTWQVSRDFPWEENMSEFIPFGDIIQANDGTLCVSGYAQTPGSTGYTYHCYFLRSRDDGRTWTIESTIAKDHNETALCQLADGTWLAAARVSGMDIYVSGDNGKTWQAQATTSTAQHPGHLLRLADGRLLLTHGDRRPGARGVGVRISSNCGKTWSPVSTAIASSISGDCGYPSSVQLADGRILTAYYSQRTPIHPRYHMGVVFWSVDEVFRPNR